MMTYRIAAIAAFLACAVPGLATAASIDFQTIGFSPGFGNTYEEDGFTVGQIGGSQMGSPSGVFYRIDVDDPRYPEGLSLVENNGETFTLESISLLFGPPFFSAPVPVDFITFTGYRDGSLVALALTGDESTGYLSGEPFQFNFGDAFSDIDRFELNTFATVGMRANPDEYAVVVTNISIAPIPLPASAWLLFGGIAGLVGLRRSRAQALQN